MKKILVDVGTFYTKVYVLQRVADNGRGEDDGRAWHYYGRGFFPTLATGAATIEKGRLYYEHQDELYAVGYDSSNSLRLTDIASSFAGEEFGAGALMILKKIIFDYADNLDELEIIVIVDSYGRAQIFEEVRTALGNGKVEVAAFRGYDRRRITKQVTIGWELFSAGDAVAGFLEKNTGNVTTALVVDVGYQQTKYYLVDGEQGVDLFRTEDCGVSFYYEKLVQLLAEEDIKDNHFLWLVKQVELGCDAVEICRESNWALAGNVYDISLVMENVRWDLNKEFTRFTAAMLTSYYTNRVAWPSLLMVTGGGAALNGDLLRLSLEKDGYRFNDVYIEKQPIYTVLEGAGYLLT